MVALQFDGFHEDKTNDNDGVYTASTRYASDDSPNIYKVLQEWKSLQNSEMIFVSSQLFWYLLLDSMYWLFPRRLEQEISTIYSTEQPESVILGHCPGLQSQMFTCTLPRQLIIVALHLDGPVGTQHPKYVFCSLPPSLQRV